jgi:hypothetical protein
VNYSSSLTFYNNRNPADFSSNLRRRYEIIRHWTFCLYRAGVDAAGTGPRSRIAELTEVLVTPEGKGIRRERYNTTLLN